MFHFYLKRVKRLVFVLCITVVCFVALFSVYIFKCKRNFTAIISTNLTKESFSLPLYQTGQLFKKHSSVLETNHILKDCLDPLLSVFTEHTIRLLLFDEDILSELIQPHAEIQKSSLYLQNNLYKSYLDKNKLIIFAIEAINFQDKDETIVKDLESQGFVVHLSMDADPRLLTTNDNVQFIPTYLWTAKDDHVIQVVILHKRLDSYMWSGPLKPDVWKTTVKNLAPALTNGENRMEIIGNTLPKYARAFESSRLLHGTPLKRNKKEIQLPLDIGLFLEEYKNSQFIECDYKRAKNYKEKYEKSLTTQDEDFKIKAKKLILKAKSALDKLNVPFSLSSGSCLGWFRQCDIIPYTIDVDFDILMHNYNDKIINEMESAGLKLMYKLGRVNDSLEYSFIGDENIKLDVFFIYEEEDHFWFSGIVGRNLQKYKYKLPMFTLCWTEFLDMKIRVPCNPEEYIQANYGKNWTVPKSDWTWDKNPPNIEKNGQFHANDRTDVFQTF